MRDKKIKFKSEAEKALWSQVMAGWLAAAPPMFRGNLHIHEASALVADRAVLLFRKRL
jgi:hypothetical protein